MKLKSLLLTALVALAGAAAATPVTYNFTGTLTQRNWVASSGTFTGTLTVDWSLPQNLDSQSVSHAYWKTEDGCSSYKGGVCENSFSGTPLVTGFSVNFGGAQVASFDSEYAGSYLNQSMFSQRLTASFVSQHMFASGAMEQATTSWFAVEAQQPVLADWTTVSPLELGSPLRVEANSSYMACTLPVNGGCQRYQSSSRQMVGNVTQISIAPAQAVPEPATLALSSIGLLVVARAARRRKG